MESRANGAKDNENVGESQSKEPDGVVDNGEEPQKCQVSNEEGEAAEENCLLYTSPSPRDS